MNIKYELISASGNPTAVDYGRYNNALKEKITRIIFKTNKQVEQIGYVYQDNKQYILEMMGNEFSGNACRAAAYSILKFKSGMINLTCAGVKMKATIEKNNISKIQIPGKFKKSELITNEAGTLIKIFGSYLLIVRGNGDINIARKIIKKYFPKKTAVGLMFIKELSKNRIYLNPFFYVKKTKTLINETACASGSLAVGIWKSLTTTRSINRLKLTQPSSLPIYVSCRYNKGAVSNFIISGPTKFLGNYSVSLTFKEK